MFYSCGFFFFLAYCQRSQIGCLPYFHAWPECEFRMQVWNVLHTTRCNTECKNLPSADHCTTFLAISLQLRHISTIAKKLVKQQRLLYMSSQYGELRPTNGWDGWWVWGTPANFNGCHVLASLLHLHRSTGSTKLHDVWPSPCLVHYIYITFSVSCPLTEFFHVQNSLCGQVLHTPILAALLQYTLPRGSTWIKPWLSQYLSKVVYVFHIFMCHFISLYCMH